MFGGGRDERGVSPVIAVILMVALAVILSSVVGVYAFGIGEGAIDSACNSRIATLFEPVC